MRSSLYNLLFLGDSLRDGDPEGEEGFSTLSNSVLAGVEVLDPRPRSLLLVIVEVSTLLEREEDPEWWGVLISVGRVPVVEFRCRSLEEVNSLLEENEPFEEYFSLLNCEGGIMAALGSLCLGFESRCCSPVTLLGDLT
jgi:hypothetical protein